MSKWEKLIHDILKEDPNLRFEDLSKALQKMGYVLHQPHSGGRDCKRTAKGGK